MCVDDAGSKTFTQKFIVNGTPSSAVLSFLADNQYYIHVNGEFVAGDEGELNFGLIRTRDITSKLIMNAENTLEIEVVNLDGPGTNPAGLSYRIDKEGNTCNSLPVNNRSVSGQKWNDVDGDGVRDEDEAGLDGVTIAVLSD